MSVSFTTEWMEYRFDEKGRLESLKDRKGGKDIAVSGSPAFYIADTHDAIIGKYGEARESAILPDRLTVRGSDITCGFEGKGVTFFLRAACHPTHVTFTVTGVHPIGAKFGQFVFAGGTVRDDDLDFCASGAGLSQNVCSLEIPGRSRRLGATLYDFLSEKPASAAVMAMPFSELAEGVKAAFAETDDILQSKKGGPYGKDVPDAHYDYLLQCHPIDPSDEGVFDRFLATGVKQVDFHQGAEYRQADFVFDPAKYPEGVKSFKERVVDKLHARGMQAGLHTYTSMIDFHCRYATPVPSHDLVAIGVYTLARDVSAEDTALPIEEDTGSIPLIQHCYARHHMTTLRVGDELIDFGAKGDHALTECARGTLDTVKSAHKKGEKLYHLENRFDYFITKPGSDLFFEVARNTAKTFNEGDFDTFYFDGCECSAGAGMDYISWYYESLFVRMVLKDVKKTPIVEYSTINGPLWAARSRAGAFDSFTSAFPYAIENHCQSNEEDSHKRLLSSQLGWYDLYPPASYTKDVRKNWFAKIPFQEDTDYLGIKSIAYDSGLSYLSKNAEAAENFPAYVKTIERIAMYSKRRASTRYAEEVLAKLKEKGSMFRLTEDGKGIERIARLYARPYSFAEGENQAAVVNPYGAQVPFVRIVGQCAADTSAEAKTVLSFDREKPLEERRCEFETPLDLSGREALGLWVKGCGRKAFLNVLLIGAAPFGVGFGEHVVSLDFTGWRYVMLCEQDNGDYFDLDYAAHPRSENWLRYHRESLSYHAIGAVHLMTNGDATGAAVGDLEAYPISDEPIRNPGVSFAGKTVAFKGELQPGEYLEYAPGAESARLYDAHGEKEPLPVEGALGELPEGESAVALTGEAKGSHRAKLHLIVRGEKIC